MPRLEEVLTDMGERVESEEDAVALDVAELAALELGQLAVRAPEAKGAQHWLYLTRGPLQPAVLLRPVQMLQNGTGDLGLGCMCSPHPSVDLG